MTRTHQIGPRLSGLAAIVTGAGSRPDDGEEIGTGAAIARLMAEAGASVTVVDIDPNAAAHTVKLIRGNGGLAKMVIADLADPAAGENVVDATISGYGRLDILVNNAAVTSTAQIEALDLAEWSRVLDLNLRGAAFMTQACIGPMAQGGGGSIINVASAAARRGFATPAYAAAKGGMLGLNTDLAVSLGPRGIRVNALIPGHVMTPMVMRNDPSQRGRMMRRMASPLRTDGSGWDVAWAALFLAGSEARWITGAELPVDAGLMASAPLPMFSALSSVDTEHPPATSSNVRG